MKKIILLSMTFICISNLFCQEKFGKYKQWENSLDSPYILSVHENINRFQVQSKFNKLYLEPYSPSERIKHDEYAISNALPFRYSIIDIAKEVWEKEKIKELAGKESVLVYIYMSDKGKFEEVTFYLKLDTSITPEEIESFENKINNTKLELRTDDLKGSNYVILNFSFNFATILRSLQNE